IEHARTERFDRPATRHLCRRLRPAGRRGLLPAVRAFVETFPDAMAAGEQARAARARLGRFRALGYRSGGHQNAGFRPALGVSPGYEFPRQEHIIRANMAEPMRRQIPRALAWTLDYLVSGALVRVLRTSWAFGLVLIYFQMMLIWWLVLSVAGGGLIAYLAAQYLGLPEVVGLLIGIACAFAIFALLRPLADRWFVVQINSHGPPWSTFPGGAPSCSVRPTAAWADPPAAPARANEAAEIIVGGHGGGGALAPAVAARALERDPDTGRRGPPLILLTLGSIAPGAALHPKAVRLRAVTARLAAEPSIVWVDCQSRADIMNFWDFDPVEGIGAHA